jgi:superfamily I DNA/RNA helicase
VTLPQLDAGDLEALVGVFPGLDFSDEECRAVLLANGSVDIQAAPGSGKTTILAARLYLLSRKWTEERQGICVISHTTVARDEIRNRLATTPEGARLLTYPHFIGTIHGFVNQFLALPELRGQGGGVDCIDDDVFARRAASAA